MNCDDISPDSVSDVSDVSDAAENELPDAEWEILSTPRGREFLTLVTSAGPDHVGPRDLARWRRDYSPIWVAAGLRLALSRRKAEGKLDQAELLWLDPVGVEQATSSLVARHKAQRFGKPIGNDAGNVDGSTRDGPLVADVCSGVGGDALELAGQGATVIAVDASWGMCRRLRWNACIRGVGDRVFPVRARAEEFRVPPEALLHLDPDRRAGRNTRARKIADYSPGWETIRNLVARTQGGALKFSPASDFERTAVMLAQGNPHPPRPIELEVISLHGECKEVTVWYGSLASCKRRATRLPEGLTWTDADLARSLARGERCENSGAFMEPREYVYDPDPALIRSGLLADFAEAMGLAPAAPGVAYLTGERALITPWLMTFRTDAVLPMDPKRIAHALAERSVGRLVIKTRGVTIPDPRQFASRLLKGKGYGSASATLLIYEDRAAGRRRVILAQNYSIPSQESPRS